MQIGKTGRARLLCTVKLNNAYVDWIENNNIL